MAFCVDDVHAARCRYRLIATRQLLMPRVRRERDAAIAYVPVTRVDVDESLRCFRLILCCVDMLLARCRYVMRR